MSLAARCIAFLLGIVLLLVTPFTWMCLPAWVQPFSIAFAETSFDGLWNGAGDNDDAILHAQSAMATVDTFTSRQTSRSLLR